MTQAVIQTGNGKSQAVVMSVGRGRDWAFCAAAVGILALLYLVLWNGYWSAGGDSPYYIGIARNLVAHNFSLKSGHFLNGNFVASSPPGWPLVLAAAMKVSSRFLFLNLVPLACMLIAAGLWYWVLRRFTTPGKSLLIVVLSGILYNSYSSSNQLRSEALFCALFSGALVVAFQIAEDRGRWWRMVLLLALCAGMVQARYAGMPAWIVIGAALLSGKSNFKWDRRSWAVALSLAVTLSTFVGMRYLLQKVLPPPPIHKSALQDEIARRLPAFSDEPTMLSVTSNRGILAYTRQSLLGGQWITGLLWEPTHISVTSGPLAIVMNVFGWAIVGIYTIYLVALARQRQWLLVGVSICALSIIARWTSPNPRYLVNLAPAIILGIWMGLHRLSEWTKRHWAVRACIPVFLGSVVLCNLALFAVDAYIARSGDFYHLFNAGETEQLLSCSAYVNTLGIRDGEIATNQNYVNLNRVRVNGLGWRGLTMLTDRNIQVVPAAEATARKRPKNGKTPAGNKISAERQAVLDLIERMGDGQPVPGNRALVEYMQLQHIRFYVYRPPVSPWRAWHFRVGWWQARVTKKPVVENPGWELYELRGSKLVKIEFPAVSHWPTRVPGM